MEVLFFPSWDDTGLDTKNKTTGRTTSKCPRCSHERRPQNQKKPCVSLDFDRGYFKCHNDGCDFWGYISNAKPKEYDKPQPLPPVAAEKQISQEWAELFFKRGISLDTLRKLKCQTISYAFPQDCTEGENNRQIWHETDTMVFPYYYHDTLLFHKYRGLKKQFALSKNPKLIPFNINCLFEQKGKKWEALKLPYVIFVEGEIDCASWVECGYDKSISVPNGASKNATDIWLDRTIHLLDNVDIIYLAGDINQVGIELMERIARRVGREKCKIVSYKPYTFIDSTGIERPCNDTNDVLRHHGKSAVDKCFKDARWYPVKGVKTMGDFEPDLDGAYLNGRKPFCKIGLPSLDNIFTWNNGNALTIISAKPQSAKSQFTFNVAIRLAYMHNMKFAIFSPESGTVDEIAQRLIEIATGFLVEPHNRWNLPQININHYTWAKQWVSEHFYLICESELEDLTFENYINTLEKLVKQYGINGAIADPVNMFEDVFGGNGEMMSTAVSKSLKLAKMFCIKNDVHLMLVPHPVALRGVDRIDDPYQISGGSAWFNHSDNIILMNREFAEVPMKDGRGDNIELLVRKCKKAFAGRRGEALLAYHVPTGVFGEIDSFGNAKFENMLVWNTPSPQPKASIKSYFDGEGNTPNIKIDYDAGDVYEEDEAPF